MTFHPEVLVILEEPPTDLINPGGDDSYRWLIKDWNLFKYFFLRFQVRE
jgi:hypothetical protein